MTNADDDELGLIDIAAMDDEDGGIDDGLDASKFPRRVDHQSRAERAAGEWQAGHERAMLAEYDKGAVAASTREKYEANWQQFGGFCHRRGIDPYDAKPDDVRLWILQLKEDGLKMSTITGRLGAVRWHFEEAGLASPTTTKAVSSTLEATRRSVGTGQRRARALMLIDLRKIVATMHIVMNRPADDLRVLRDRAMLTLGWAAALRVSEIVALNIEDVTFHGDPKEGTGGGAVVKIRRSKTDQHGDGAEIVVPYAQHLDACPVRATMILQRKLMDVTNRDPLTGRRLPVQTSSGPLFRNINRGGNLEGRLTRQGVAGIVKWHVANVLGHDPAPYSTHSLRAGFVTECDNRGVKEQIIRRTTRHTSSASLNIYDRPHEAFANTALGDDWW